ncbi:MAG: alginate export family protein [Bacteroidota bacterium]
MSFRKILLSALLMILSVGLYAQFTVDGEFRTRSGINHGYKVPVKSETDAVLSFDQRSRLILGYSKGILATKFTLQDARIWGADDLFNKTGIEGNSSSFGVHEAWAQIETGKYSDIRIGRQEWNYDDMRILSWRNWWTSALSYDGLLFKHHNTKTGWSIDAGLSYNNYGSRSGNVDNSMWNESLLKTMNFFNAKKKFNEKLSVSIMLTYSGKQDMAEDELAGTGTHGININYNRSKTGTDGLFAQASAYYQHGKDLSFGSDGERKSISAHLLTAELGLRTLEKKLEISAGMEMISGRDYSNTEEKYNNTRHSFDLFYSGRFPYYGGHINYFLVQDSYKIGTKGGGYFDPFFKVKYKASKKDIIDFAVFNPILTTKVAAHTGFDPISKKPVTELDGGNPVYWKGGLGTHIDLDYTRKISKEITLKTGVSYAMVSDIKNQMVYGYKSGEQLNDLGQNYFVYTMLIVKPNFFSSK